MFVSLHFYKCLNSISLSYSTSFLFCLIMDDPKLYLSTFQSASDIGDDVTPNSIISKLSLLALHFPRLRIIWSRSLHATAEIFASLKANQDEPDETKAVRVGVPSEDGIVENDVRQVITTFKLRG